MNAEPLRRLALVGADAGTRVTALNALVSLRAGGVQGCEEAPEQPGSPWLSHEARQVHMYEDEVKLLSLYRITVYFETDAPPEVEALAATIESAICPYHAAEPHTCPRRWMIMTAEMDPADAEEVEDLLNE